MIQYNPYELDRHSIRLKGFDYSSEASVMNIRDFMADSIGHEFVGLVARAIDDNYRRYNH